MAIVQLLLALLSRTAGRVLNTAFAWATIALFGRVPAREQLYLSVMAFGSIAWLVATIGIAWPSFATFLLAFVTIPPWVRPGWIRLAMLAAAIVTPLLVGALCLLALDPAQRPQRLAARARAVLKGYPVTVGLALTLVLLLLFVPLLKARAATKRWTTTHVPVLVEPKSYAQVLRDLQRALAAGGWHTRQVPASWLLRLPMRLFAVLGGRSVPLVAEQLTTLRSSGLEATLHPSDLILSGPEHDVMRARARVAVDMAFSALYMTWTKEGRQLEDALRRSWMGVDADGTHRHGPGRTRGIERDLHGVEVPYEEWEVLFRKVLLLDRRLAEACGDVPRRRRPQAGRR
jgi:hypothetical protein